MSSEGVQDPFTWSQMTANLSTASSLGGRSWMGDAMRRLVVRVVFSAWMIVATGAIVNGCRQVVIHLPT